MMETTWRQAIERVLRESGMPMHYSDIAEQILTKGYHRSDGATPNSTVNALITSAIKRKGELSKFVKVGKGIYGLREVATQSFPEAESSDLSEEKDIKGLEKPTAAAVVDFNSDESVIRCLGMFWNRDLVLWKGDSRIFGKQQASSKPIDFSRQRGIYILYDRHSVIYVGRSVDRPLGRRLFEHTFDRLGGRWDRFSWFGLLDVSDEGSLVEVPLRVTVSSLITTLEALLIETLEPQQNRKRGDDFSVIEYIQEIDPELKERKIFDTLRSIEEKMRSNP